MNTYGLKLTMTSFLRGPDAALEQRLDVTIDNPGMGAEMALRMRAGQDLQEAGLGWVPAGESRHAVFFPAALQPVETHFSLRSGDTEFAILKVTRKPPKRWTVHVVQNSHHDLGYTGLPSHILRQHDRWLRDALEYARDTDAYPDAARFRIVIEQAWSLEHFLATATEGQTAEMLGRLRAGRFEVNALYANLTTELCSGEELIRALYPAFRLKRRHGVPLTSAEHNDIPGFSWGLAEVLLGAGVRLFVPGLPLYYNWGYAGLESFWDQEAILPHGGPGAFWWQSPSGGRILVWDGGAGCGGDARASLPGLAEKLAQLDEQDFAFETLRWPVIGAASDNSPYRPDYADAVRDWNARWTWPRLVCSTNAGFYADFTREDLNSLPVFRGELPGQDYPVGAMSTAAATGVNRRSHAALSTAETAAAAARLLHGADYPDGDLDEAWREMLLHDEHTWGFQFPAGPAAAASQVEKAARAYRAAALAQDVAAKALVGLSGNEKEGDPCILVFNSLGEARGGTVRMPLRPLDNAGRVLSPVEGMTAAECYRRVTSLPGRDQRILPAEFLDGRFDLVDRSTGRKVPYQLEEIGGPEAALPHAAERVGLAGGSKRLGLFEVPTALKLDLVFQAEDVPACGYKTYRLEPRKTHPRFPRTLRQSATTIENEFYRLSVERDGTIHLYDKEAGRELVDPAAPHPLGALVLRGPEGGERLSRVRKVGRGAGGPAGASLDLVCDAPGHPRIIQTFRLDQGRKQVELALNVLKDATPLLDAHLAFPFDLPQPRFRYEGALAALSPVDDFFPGAQSDRLTVQNWVRVSSGDFNLLWSSSDAPVASLGNLWEGYVSPAHRCQVPGSLHSHHRLEAGDFQRGWIYSLLFANNFGTNFAVSQSGYALFRYRFSTAGGAVSDAQSAAWGQAAVSDLETALLPGAPDAKSASLVEVDGARLLAVKAAEDGRGWIVRLWNPAPYASRCRVVFPDLQVSAVSRVSLIEEDQEPLALERNGLEITISAMGLTSLRISV
jgi:alpha-mannosidase